MKLKKWTGWMIPYSLECFANAKEVVITPMVWEIPEEVDASLKAQLSGWHGSNRPTSAIVGMKSRYELIRSRHFSMMPVMEESGSFDFQIYGLTMHVTDKIEENGVIVF